MLSSYLRKAVATTGDSRSGHLSDSPPPSAHIGTTSQRPRRSEYRAPRTLVPRLVRALFLHVRKSTCSALTSFLGQRGGNNVIASTSWLARPFLAKISIVCPLPSCPARHRPLHGVTPPTLCLDQWSRAHPGRAPPNERVYLAHVGTCFRRTFPPLFLFAADRTDDVGTSIRRWKVAA